MQKLWVALKNELTFAWMVFLHKLYRLLFIIGASLLATFSCVVYVEGWKIVANVWPILLLSLSMLLLGAALRSRERQEDRAIEEDVRRARETYRT